MIGLTERQEECLEFIVASVKERGFPPTIREIGNKMGVTSTNGVKDHIKALERKGFVVMEPGLSRGIRVAILPEGKVVLGWHPVTE